MIELEMNSPTGKEYKMTEKRFTSASCKGEHCFCGSPAETKIEETIFWDDPHKNRHPFTRYICHDCFDKIMNRMIRNYEIIEQA